MTDRSPLALLCAVPLEAGPLLRLLQGAQPGVVGRRAATRGLLGGRPVLVLPTGMGKVNAAQAATALLEAEAVAGVIGFGVAGAYPGAGLALGEVALASHAVYGDEGVDAPNGWLSTQAMGIPLLEHGGARRYNDFPLDAARVERAAAALAAAGIGVRHGPFVTVSACSGTAARGRAMAERVAGALCESMEGAALAHVCALYDAPYLEVRAVSNQVEDRDLSRWRLRDAAEAAARAAAILAAVF